MEIHLKNSTEKDFVFLSLSLRVQYSSMIFTAINMAHF